MFEKIRLKAKEIKINTAQLYLAMKSNETPWYAKALGVITVGYALSPIDLIPDFIPVLGYLDDIIILPLLISLCIKLIPKDIWDSFEEEAKTIWNNGKPTKWYFAVPIVCIWILVIALIGFLIFGR